MKSDLTKTANPMGYTCASNYAPPSYVTEHNFRTWLAYGLTVCWLGSDDEDPNSDCNFHRPITIEDVQELRDHFLDLVERTVINLWRGDFSPGDGWSDETESLVMFAVNDEDLDEHVRWLVRLDDDAMMFEMQITGADSTAIWLAYDAIEDRQAVLKAFEEAAAVVPHFNVWRLLKEAAEQSVKDSPETQTEDV